jgi:hypothetical protein
LYWTDYIPLASSDTGFVRGKFVKKVPLGGGAQVTVVSLSGLLNALAVDATGLYFADSAALYHACK